MSTNEAQGDATPPASGELPSIPDVTLGRELARGGMGIVYRGRQEFLERDVAVKVLAPELQGERFAARFRREAKLLAGIKHAHIVACYAAGVTPPGQHYLVMELVEGPTLEQWITKNGSVPVRSAVRIASQLAAALGHACDLGVIHRDIKTANILLEASSGSANDPSGDPQFPFMPKLVDLGLARMVAASADLAQTAPGAVMGTPATMAPEQFDAPDAVDFRADIYGLGCVLFEMLTGAPAYASERLTDLVVAKRQPRGPDPSQRSAAVPAPLGELVAAMLAQNPGDRPTDYANLRARLDAAVAAPAPAVASAVREPAPAAPMSVKPRPAALRAVEPPPATGPNLLRTAEFDFLAGDGAVVQAAVPGSAFVSRIVEPRAPAADSAAVRASAAPAAAPAAAAPAATPPLAPAAARPAPTAAPRRVIGALPAAPRHNLGRWLAAAAAIGLVTFAAVPIGRDRETVPLPATPPAAGPAAAAAEPAFAAAATPATGNRPPLVEMLGTDVAMRRGDRVLLRSRAEDADGDPLQYEWSVQPARAAELATPNAPSTALQHQLLPGDEFTLTLAVQDGQQRAAVERRVIVQYEPENLLADFLSPNGGWQTAGRARMPWRQRGDGAVVAVATDLPNLRTRTLLGRNWRIGGTLLAERAEKNAAGTGAMQGAVSLRLGPQRHLAIVYARDGQAADRAVLSLQQLQRDDLRPGIGNGQRPLPEAQAARLESAEAGAASFTLTRRGDELSFQFGFAGRKERSVHVERLPGDLGEVALGLMARGGRVVFSELKLW